MTGVRRLLAVAALTLTITAPAYGYYSDGGSGGNRPDCTADNVGYWWGDMECGRDPFAPPDTGYEWHWGY